MLKKTIKYEDLNGEEVTEDFYFHFSEAELVELEMSKDGGMSDWIKGIVAAENGAVIMAEMKNIILSAYGKRSPDGKRFLKTEAIREEFASSEAYSALFMEMVTTPDAAAQFASGLVSKKLADRLPKIVGADLSIVPSDSAERKQFTKAQLIEMDTQTLAEALLNIKEGRATVVDTFS